MSVADGVSVILPDRSTPAADTQARRAMEAAKIRLLKFVAGFGFGGTERQVANLVKMLDRARFDLRFGCLKRWGHFLEEIDRHQIPLAEYSIDSLYKAGALRQHLRLASDIRRQRIQIVHSYNFYANVFAIPAAKLAGVPVIVASVRDAGVYLTPAQKCVQNFVIRFADCILVNAEAIRRWLIEQGCAAAKIRVIKNGIDLSRFNRKKNDTGLRRELGLSRSAPLVMVLSRLNPQKGIEYFLQAAAAVGRSCPSARFLVVGDGFVRRNDVIESDVTYQQALKQHAAKLGLGERVIFTGFRADVPELLSEAAVSVLPSLSEGLSNTLLESMAAGVPVVASRVGGNPEVIEDGIGGYLVPPRDPGALAQAISAILKDRDLARDLGEQSRRRIVERFSLERMVHETQELYVQLLERKTQRKGRGYGEVNR